MPKFSSIKTWRYKQGEEPRIFEAGEDIPKGWFNHPYREDIPEGPSIQGEWEPIVEPVIPEDEDPDANQDGYVTRAELIEALLPFEDQTGMKSYQLARMKRVELFELWEKCVK